jgi:hypothetical protein
MKTQIKFLGITVFALLFLSTTTACRKYRHERRIERAIDDKIGTYLITGKIGDITYHNETMTVSKMDKTKVFITSNVLPKTYSFEIKNDVNIILNSPLIVGLKDHAIVYEDEKGLVFAITEVGSLILDDPINEVSIGGAKK